MIPEIYRFLIVGGIATVLQYATLWLGVDVLGWRAAIASGLGYFLGSIVSYVMNYFITFRSQRSHAQAIFNFLIMVAGGWGFNTGVMIILVDIMLWNMWLSQALATAIALVWNYWVSRTLVFR